MRKKTAKFGGSSLADAEGILRVADIIRADPARRYIVPSAPGKRSPGDTKITDLLYSCHEKAEKREDFTSLFERIEERFLTVAERLGTAYDPAPELRFIKERLSLGCGRDFAASRGEYLCGRLLASLIGFDFIDASDVIFFTEDGAFDGAKTYASLRKALEKHKRAVIPGFYGSLPDGRIKTFTRGGSDITGAIVARASGSDIYENFTDVRGLLAADPEIVDSPRVIGRISYRELRELSCAGAKVLHGEAILPVSAVGIPVNIRSTYSPDDLGTMIVSDTGEGSERLTGIAGERGYTLIRLGAEDIQSRGGFGSRLFSILEGYGVRIGHLPSGVDGICAVVPTASLDSNREKVIEEIKESLSPDSLEIRDGVALISVVGRGTGDSPKAGAEIFSALSEADISVLLTDRGANDICITVGVDARDLQKAIRSIYRRLFGN